jgi:hypothetical protein
MATVVVGFSGITKQGRLKLMLQIAPQSEQSRNELLTLAFI